MRVLAGKVAYLPSAVEGSGPFPDQRGHWMNEPGDDAERHVAASLYAAMMTATCLDLIGNAGTIIVEGPFAGNLSFTKALAAITGGQVLVTDGNSPSGTGLGATLLATRNAPRQSYHPATPLNGVTEYYRSWREGLQPIA